MDRKLSVYQAPAGMEVFAAVFPPGTCLDGEVVQNRTWNQLVFMVFDILTYGPQSFCRLNFQARYEALTNTACGAYTKWIHEVNRDQMPPMPLVRKKWYRRNQITQVINKLFHPILTPF